MRYHGNYCGSNWSDGITQQSVVGTTMPIDDFDNTCMLHDATYATQGNLKQADYQFAAANLGFNSKRTAAGLLVGLQGLLRTPDKSITNNNNFSTSLTSPMMKKQSKNLRGSATRPNININKKKITTLSTVPAAYGFSLKMGAPNVTRNGNTAVITGSDFAGSVYATNTALYEPACSVLLNPIYFNNSMLGNLSRTYEKFRFKRATIQYVPSVPTSTQGQIIMTSTSTVKEPFIAANSSTFLSRALSQGNAVACPVWKEETIDLPGSSEWFVVDALIDGDLDDCIQEEVQVYATCESTLTVGILIMHYEIEFKDPLFTYHPTVIPSPVANGTIITLQDDSAINAITDVAILTSPSVTLTGLGQGGIFRLVFQQGRSTLPGGVTWANIFRVGTASANSNTNTTLAYTNLSMTSGMVFYAVLNNNFVFLYTSYEGASAGFQNDAVFYQTATSASVGTYSFLISAVKLGPSLRVTTQ